MFESLCEISAQTALRYLVVAVDSDTGEILSRSISEYE